MSNLPRRGRPPRVVEEDGVYRTKVKGVEYTFKQDANGNVRPVNTRVGDAEGREYAKNVVRRTLAD